MAIYRISGVWKDSNDVITHYAVHHVDGNTIARAVKRTKADTISLVEHKGNETTTWLWMYDSARWIVGEKVEVVIGNMGKYLRTNPNHILTDNLKHLIDYDWIFQ